MKDLTVILENRPGTMAAMGEALGLAGINMEGMCGLPCGGRGVIHILVEDAAAARRALQEGGFEVGDERDVLIVELVNRPGTLGETTRRLADAGINIDLAYGSFQGAVLGVDDIDKARSVL